MDDLSYYAKYLATNKTVGCFKSHIAVWKQVIDRNLPFAVVLEDDAIPVEKDKWMHQIQSTIEKMSIISVPWDVILLGYHSTYMTQHADKNEILFNFLKITEFAKKSKVITEGIIIPVTFIGTHAYLVSNVGAQKLLNECKIINRIPVDLKMCRLHVQNKITTFACVPPIINTYGANESHYITWVLQDGLVSICGYELTYAHYIFTMIASLFLLAVTHRKIFLLPILLILVFIIFQLDFNN